MTAPCRHRHPYAYTQAERLSARTPGRARGHGLTRSAPFPSVTVPSGSIADRSIADRREIPLLETLVPVSC
jgi:hypothetical protein